jgi:hypothetical protein
VVLKKKNLFLEELNGSTSSSSLQTVCSADETQPYAYDEDLLHLESEFVHPPPVVNSDSDSDEDLDDAETLWSEMSLFSEEEKNTSKQANSNFPI